MYGLYAPRDNTRSTIATLRSMGITKATVSFSGGNDEGSVDTITLHKADGTTDTLDGGYGVHKAYGEYEKDKTGKIIPAGTWIAVDKEAMEGAEKPYPYVYRLATEDEKARASLASALSEPVNARYGSFAGEFYVSGEFVWDVAAGTVTEAEQHYESTYDRYNDE